jgi:phosphoserine aminotransferase
MTTYFTPGPSEPYPQLHDFLEDAWEEHVISLSHRGEEFIALYMQTDNALRSLLTIPEDYQILFTGSATEAMERIVQGVVNKSSHHFVYGAFSLKWLEIARQLGKQPTVLQVNFGDHFSHSDLRVPKDAELVCITHNETSTGAAFPLKEINYIAEQSAQTLIAVDIVSSAPIVVLPWKRLDLVYFSIQKAFGLPAGLGVLVISPRALRKAQTLQNSGLGVGSYHSLVSLAEFAKTYQTPATPNVLGIYLLGRVADAMNIEGLDAIRAENQRRADQLYAIIDANPYFEPLVKAPEWRSQTVAVMTVQGGSKRLHDQLVMCDLLPSKGYGKFKEEQLRIANFPAINGLAYNKMLDFLSDYRSQ